MDLVLNIKGEMDFANIKARIKEKKIKYKITKLYKKILKNWSEIQEGEIEVRLIENDPNSVDVAFFGLDLEINLKTNQVIFIKPSISLRDEIFSYFADDEIEACITHELGHYLRWKKHFNSPKSLARCIKWAQEMNRIVSSSITRSDSRDRYPEAALKRINKINKWYILNEIYADNKVVEAGYGEQMIRILDTFNSMATKNDSLLAEMVETEYETRRANLEKKLGEEAR